MAKQNVNIGTEGNDATGDSIRESFRKVNENFTERYAVFGVGGQINFTTLSDTPDSLEANKIIMTNTTGASVVQNTLASNSALDDDATDTITFASTQATIPNNFGTIAVSGQSDVVADTTSDTLTFVEGNNVTITTDAGTDSITINATSTALTIQDEGV